MVATMAFRLLATMARPPVLLTALRVSALVGSILNAINLGPALLAGTPPDWWKLALNYAVPFLVASYSGASARLDRNP